MNPAPLGEAFITQEDNCLQFFTGAIPPRSCEPGILAGLREALR